MFKEKAFSFRSKRLSNEPLFYVLLLGVLFLVNSCYQAERQIDDSLINNDKWESEFSILRDTIFLPIDESTSQRNMQYQFYRDSSGSEIVRYFVIHNQLKSRLQFYDLEQRRLDFSIDLATEGPNALDEVTDAFSSFYVKSLDSIYFLSSQLYRFYLVNAKGEKLNTLDFSSFNGELWPLSPDYSQMHERDGELIFATQLRRGKKAKLSHSYVHSFNFENHAFKSYRVPHPEFYPRGVWVDQDYFFSHLPIPNSNSLILSYPMSHKVHRFNNGNFEPFNTKSVRAVINEPTEKERSFKVAGSFEPMIKYKSLNAVYLKLLHDRENDLILRQVRLPMSEQRFLNGPPYKFENSLVVLNGEMERIGEFFIPSSLYLFMADRSTIYISPEELNLDEDYIRFIRMRIIKK